MFKHILLGCLLSGLSVWQLAGASHAADDEFTINAKNQIHDIAVANPRSSSHDVTPGGDLNMLTPTQAVGKLLPANSPLLVRWALPLKDALVRRLSVPPFSVKGQYRFFLVETDQNDLIAVRMDNGAPLWWIKTPAPIFGEIFFNERSIHFICASRLVALEKNSGDIRWNVQLPCAPAAGPAAHSASSDKEIIFITGMNRKVYCLDIIQEAWPSSKQKQVFSSNFSVNIVEPRILWQYRLMGVSTHTPVFDDNCLYVGSHKKRLYGIMSSGDSITNGAPGDENVWIERTNGDNIAAPVTEGPHIIFPSLDHYLYCLTDEKGGVVWKYMAAAPLTVSPQLLYDEDNLDRCFCLTQRVGDADLLGIDNKNGTPLWQHDKGMRIVGIAFDERSRTPENRFLALSYDSDSHISAIMPMAKDTRSEEDKNNDNALQRAMTAKIAWRMPVSAFTEFAANNHSHFVFCATADRKTVCVLEKAH